MRHVWWILGVVGLFLALHSYCYSALLEPDAVFVQMQKYLPGSSDPLLSQQISPFYGDQMQPNYELQLGIDLSLPKSLYWTNLVSAMTDQRQFRQISWQFAVGAKIDRWQLFFGHKSQHALDSFWATPIPQYFSLGVRYNLFTKETR